MLPRHHLDIICFRNKIQNISRQHNLIKTTFLHLTPIFDTTGLSSYLSLIPSIMPALRLQSRWVVIWKQFPLMRHLNYPCSRTDLTLTTSHTSLVIIEMSLIRSLTDNLSSCEIHLLIDCFDPTSCWMLLTPRHVWTWPRGSAWLSFIPSSLL